MLINGDDCLFPLGREDYSFWSALTAFGGLKRSVGKCFRARGFANVNSTFFLFREGAFDSTVVRRTAVNYERRRYVPGLLDLDDQNWDVSTAEVLHLEEQVWGSNDEAYYGTAYPLVSEDRKINFGMVPVVNLGFVEARTEKGVKVGEPYILGTLAQQLIADCPRTLR